MGLVKGVSSIKNDDTVMLESGKAVDLGGSISSCGKCFSIKIISWKECDTLSKKIGFISGKIIKFISNIASKGYRFIARTIEILHIQKPFKVLFDIIKDASKKLYNLSVWLFEECIIPIFDNKIAKKIGNSIIRIVFEVSDYLINSKVVRSIFEKSINVLKIVLKPVYNRVLEPLFNKMISPVLDSISDIFLGSVGGFSKKEEKNERDQRV